MKNFSENKRTFTYLSFLLFLSIVFLLSFVITKNLVKTEKSKLNLKLSVGIVKELLKKDILNPKLRFTSLYLSGNRDIFFSLDDYKNGYKYFNNEKSKLYSAVNENMNLIHHSLESKNELPVFFDDISKYTFIPLKAVKVKNNAELTKTFNTVFSPGISKSNISFATNKILNYIYIEINTGIEVMVLLSLPKDPDPLFPGNKRHAMIICQENKDKTGKYSSYVENVILSNSY